MIQSIHLRNYQAHKNSRLELHPGVNAIAGQSDRGKSSIIRAIRLVHENRPAGDSYRSHFADKQNTEVTITVPEGSVSRVRGPKDNHYQVGDKKLTANGLKVPDEVSSLLNMRPVNFQYQMDRPFLLDLHSSKLAQYLNEEVNLDVIDRAVSNIRKRTLNNNEELRSLEAQQEALETSLQRYEGLDEVEGRLAAAEALERAIKAKEQQATDLYNLIARIGQNQERTEKLRSLVAEAKGPFERCQIFSRQKQEAERQEEALGQLITRIKTSQAIIAENKKAVTKAGPVLKRCQGLLQQIEDKQGGAEALGRIIQSIARNQKQIKRTQTAKELALGNYKAAIPENCPTCGAQKEDMRLPV